MPGLRSRLRKSNLPGSAGDQRFGQLIRVYLDVKSFDRLSRISKASRRPKADIICAAARHYIQDPRHYRPRIEPTRFRNIVSARIPEHLAAFFADEAFHASVWGRANFLGMIVSYFLALLPDKAWTGLFLSYADIVDQILKEREHGRHTFETRRRGLRGT